MSLPVMSMPVFFVDLISTGEKVRCRPFSVKEMKILMIAAESNTEAEMTEAAKQIIQGCSFGKLDVNKLPLFDIQNLFVKIRSKSIGEIIEFIIPCSACEAKIPVKANLENIEIIKHKDHSTKIMLSDEVGITLKYPTIELENNILKNTENRSPVDIDFKVITSCIENIFDQHNVYLRKDIEEQELNKFVENLTTEQYKKISKFFETMPSMKYTLEYACPKCKAVGKYEIKDFMDFFD